MHLLIPFASAVSAAAVRVLRDLELPNLVKLLRRLEPTARDEADEYTLSPPHERALGALRGWHAADGELPFGAHAAGDDGIAVGDDPWGLITPAHWHVGRDHVTLIDPAELHLRADESRALFDAVGPLFGSDGFGLFWGAAERWHVKHAALQGLATASLDRVIGRSVDLWMRGDASPRKSSVADRAETRDPAGAVVESHAGAAAGAATALAPGEAARLPFARLVRRLQSECQLTLYPHPINEAREARGELSVNSFWLSGCGVAQPTRAIDLDIDTSLRTPLMAADWAAWAEAWQALDRGRIAAALQAAESGAAVQLTLCGERGWQRYERSTRGLVARIKGLWQAPAPHAVLEAL